MVNAVQLYFTVKARIFLKKIKTIENFRIFDRKTNFVSILEFSEVLIKTIVYNYKEILKFSKNQMRFILKILKLQIKFK